MEQPALCVESVIESAGPKNLEENLDLAVIYKPSP